MVGSMKRVDVATTGTAWFRKRRASPGEWLLALLHEEQIGYFPSVTSITVSERMNEHQLMMELRTK